MNALRIFDTSQGVVVVEQAAMKMMDMSSEQKQLLLKTLNQQIIQFLEENKGNYQNLQVLLYTYGVDLYRTANYINVMFDNVYNYLEETAKPIFEWFSNNGLQLHLLIANDFSDFTRPLEVFPSFFAAAGLPCVSPIDIAFSLMKKDGYKITDFNMLYSRYKEEVASICDEIVKELIDENRSYIYIDPNEDNLKHFELSMTYKEKDGHLVALKTSGPEDGKGSLFYSIYPKR